MSAAPCRRVGLAEGPNPPRLRRRDTLERWSTESSHGTPVTPAQAAVPCAGATCTALGMPAFAGMTRF